MTAEWEDRSDPELIAAQSAVAKLLAKNENRLQDPQTAYGQEVWLFWSLFIDALKLFVRLTGREPTVVYMPPAMFEMVKRYNREVNKREHEVTEIMGCIVYTDVSDLWFD